MVSCGREKKTWAGPKSVGPGPQASLHGFNRKCFPKKRNGIIKGDPEQKRDCLFQLLEPKER